MRGAIVALDVDSVLFPVNEHFVLPELQKWWNPDVSLGDITAFSYKECLGAEAEKIAYGVFRRPNLYDGYDLASFNGECKLAVDWLRETYSRVIAVTSPFAEHATSKWRYLQRCGFAHEDIVLCGDKSLVTFDVLLDDRAETAMEVGPSEAVIFDRPWNRHAGLEYQRAYGWADVPRKITRLLKEADDALVDTRISTRANEGTCVHGVDLRRTCDNCGRVFPNDL